MIRTLGGVRGFPRSRLFGSGAAYSINKDFNIVKGSFNAGSNDIDVKGDFINAGTFNAGTGLVTLNGTAQQNLNTSGSNGTFNDLTINNTSGDMQAINLQSDVEISGTLTLNEGIIYTGTGASVSTVKILSGASASAGNANSFVDGEVARTGTTAFVFPIGDVDNSGGSPQAIYAPIETEACASSTISAEYHFENPPYDWWFHSDNIEESLDHITDREYWDLTSDNAYPGVTLHWTDNTGDIHSFGAESGEMTETWVANNMSIAHFDVGDYQWKDMGAEIPTGESNTFQTGKLKSTASFSGYSPMTFASKNPDWQLPVELVSFSAECNGNDAVLEWITSSEINNDYFKLERSTDAKNWETVAKVNGAGNSSELRTYEYVDKDIPEGRTYYRLTQVDYDGTQEVFEIREVNCGNIALEEPVVTCFPNPFNTTLNVFVESWPEDKAVIELYDMIGNRVRSWDMELHNGRLHKVLRVDDLPAAVYIMRIQSKDVMINQKLEKK